ncbi:ABC transporter ATP-binding protein [Nordella sp. HKS 07]|uniref:ABC transporter ATP-binding protein n=1 Tax=Nordella sp. HKS 07 TaxID=2712222 RepID=UPI0013E18B30|nr:ABC transporter ATP-binding protein [Nordella sp. HKS 07]QIG48585.1 ABC transporter ATP-binding protein [Nordella sp. HKS 07]
MTDALPALLSVQGLSIGFTTEEGPIRVVEDVSFTVAAGETMGLVGESGCGKSVTAQTIMRLLPSPPSRIEAGRIAFDGSDLAQADEMTMRAIRGDKIAMIFQEPMTSLNPTMTIGGQIAEALLLHRGLNARNARPLVLDMLTQVGIGRPEKRYAQYPHELSGGLRQRVMIAMALICGPKLLIADEPTTALDVTIQAQILELMKALQRERAIAILLITHDLGVVEEMCDHVVVMYAGRIAETAKASELFARPRHPYTAGLLAAAPRHARRGQTLTTIPGTVPPPGERGRGCSFAERCDRALPRCRHDVPSLTGDGHRAACWNPVP